MCPLPAAPRGVRGAAGGRSRAPGAGIGPTAHPGAPTRDPRGAQRPEPGTKHPGAGEGRSPARRGSRGPTPGRVGAVPPRRGRREGGAAGAARGRVTHAVISAARARRQRRAGGGTAGPHKGRRRAPLPHSPRTAEADGPAALRSAKDGRLLGALEVQAGPSRGRRRLAGASSPPAAAAAGEG